MLIYLKHDDQVRNTLSDVKPIDIEYLLEDNQRAVNFLTTGTQEDKQRFVNLLHAKLDREWEARKAVSQARRTPRRPDIYAYVEDLGVNSSLIRPHYELPIDMVASSKKNKSRQGITIRKNKQPVNITVLMCITVTLYQVVPRHLILQRILLLILPKSEPGQLQKN